MKKTVLALAFVLFGSFMLSGCSKDEILDHYNNIVQSAGTIELTGKLSLEGTKEKGIDDYTGTYTADYATTRRTMKPPLLNKSAPLPGNGRKRLSRPYGRGNSAARNAPMN